jgi:hypothetical protein
MKMKTRFYIMETYCGGYLGTSYSVNTEAEALAIVEKVKADNEDGAFIKVEKQTKKWYQRYWRPVEVVAEWWN